MEDPRPAAGADLVSPQPQRVGHRKLDGKRKKRQRLIKIAMEDSKKFECVSERGPADQNVIEDESMIVSADEATVYRRGGHHDRKGEYRKRDQRGATPITRR